MGKKTFKKIVENDLLIQVIFTSIVVVTSVASGIVICKGSYKLINHWSLEGVQWLLAVFVIHIAVGVPLHSLIKGRTFYLEKEFK